MGWIDTAALGVSIVAVFVAGGSYCIARRAAKESAKASHYARAPQLVASFVPSYGGGYCLRVLNEAPSDLQKLVVELVTVAEAHQPGLRGISDARPSGTSSKRSVDLGPLRVGDFHDLRLWRNGRMGGAVVRLRCTCKVDGEDLPWLVSPTAVAPPDAF